MNRGTSNRGARGAATSTRGSTTRGRGRGASRGGSSSKFENPHGLPADGNSAYVPRGPKGQAQPRPKLVPHITNHKRFPLSQFQPNVDRSKNRHSNYHTGSTPEPATQNSFENDRMANAARREQRGQRGGSANTRGASESRGTYIDNSVRFKSQSPQPKAPAPQAKPSFGQQPKFGPKPGGKPFVIPKKAGAPHPKSRLSQSFTSSSSDDEHVTKIRNTLQRNGLSSDPPWPMAQPGDPRQNSAVKDFWNKTKEHRNRVRKILMNAGLIDDPDKPKKLSEAIDFKGTCEEMCPRFEQVARIMEHDVKNLERVTGPDGTLWPVPGKMIKAYGRSSAGQDAPLPDDIRTPAALRRTLDYLIQDIVGNQNTLPAVHNFLWDRTRSIRRDFTFQQASLTPTEYADEVYCLETIARFHVVALHQMSDPSNTSDDFSEHQEIEQLGRTLLSLIHTYEDCKGLNIPCTNEAEFRAYFVVYHARNPAMMEAVQDWGREFWTSDDIQTATSIVESLHNIWEINGPLRPHSATDLAMNFVNRFFTIVKQSEMSYVMACFAEIHFNSVRKAALTTILSAYRKQRDQTTDWSVAALSSLLHFDSLDDVEEFVEAHGLNIKDVKGGSYLDFEAGNEPIEPETKVKQPHSMKLVERKRGNKSLPDCIYTNVYAPAGVQDEEDSLFVAQSNGSNFSNENPFQRSQTQSQPSFPTVSNPFGQPTAAATSSLSGKLFSNPPQAPKKFGAFIDSDDDMPQRKAGAAAGSISASGAPAELKAPQFSFVSQPSANMDTPPITQTLFETPFGTPSQQQPSQTAGPPTSKPSTNTGPSLFQTVVQKQASSLPAFPGTSAQTLPPASNNESPKPFGGFNFSPAPAPASSSPSFFAAAENAPTSSPPKFNFSTGPAQSDTRNASPLLQPAATSQTGDKPGEPVTSTAQNGFVQTPTAITAPSGSEQSKAASSIFGSAKTKEAVSNFGNKFAPKPTETPAPPAATGTASQQQLPTLYGQSVSQPPVQPSQSGLLGSLGNSAVSWPAPSKPTESATPRLARQSTSEPVKFNWLAGPSTKNAIETVAKPADTSSNTFRDTATDSTPSPPAPAPVSRANAAKVPPYLARWILMDEGGILDQFIENEVSKACKAAMEHREKELAVQKALQEKEDKEALQQALDYRKYALSVKYFYRWRENARKVKQMRRGADMRLERMRAAQERMARRTRQKKEVVADFSKSVTSNHNNKRKAMDDQEQMLRSSGILNGVRNPHMAASQIVRGDMGPPRPTTPLGSPMHNELSKSTSAFNQSTASLQSLVDGGHILRRNESPLRRSASDRTAMRHSRSRSVTSNASRSRSRPQTLFGAGASMRNPSPSGVQTDYFRLKARGIQTLPNGMPVANAALLDFRSSVDSDLSSEKSEYVPYVPRRSFGCINSRSLSGGSTAGPKRSVSSLSLSRDAKRVRASPLPTANPNHMLERARHVMAENAYSKRQEEYSLRVSTSGKSEEQREAEMQELFRRSARIKEEMSKGEEWYKSQRMSMSRSSSRVRAESEEMERGRKMPPPATTRMNPGHPGQPMSFGTPVKTPSKPPAPSPRLALVQADVIDLDSD